MALFHSPRGSGKCYLQNQMVNTLFPEYDERLMKSVNREVMRHSYTSKSGFYSLSELIRHANQFTVFNEELDPSIMLSTADKISGLPNDKQDWILSNIPLFYYLWAQYNGMAVTKLNKSMEIYIQMTSINIYYRHCKYPYSLPVLSKREGNKRYRSLMNILTLNDKYNGVAR